jgi:hypothetical protein
MSLNAAEVVVVKDALGILQDGLAVLAPLEGSAVLKALATILSMAISYAESLLPAAPASS